MANPIDDNRFLLHLKQYSIVTNSQAIFRSEICEPLDVSFQIIAHFLNSSKDPGLNAGWQAFNISHSSRFELDVVSQESHLYLNLFI